MNLRFIVGMQKRGASLGNRTTRVARKRNEKKGMGQLIVAVYVGVLSSLICNQRARGFIVYGLQQEGRMR